MRQASLLKAALLTIFFALLGLLLGGSAGAPLPGLGGGVASALILLLYGKFLDKQEPWSVLGGFLGFIGVAVCLGVLRGATPPVEPNPQVGGLFLAFALVAGVLAGARAAKIFSPSVRVENGGEVLLLDTSSLIDGRIVELLREEYLSGTVIIPRFVLLEAQTVADSPDPVRRARGRRGLMAAEQIEAQQTFKTLIITDDFPSEGDVDAKLTAIAKARGARLVTTDYNLAKVAQLQGVKVLNIHGLAQAMRPVYTQGEKVRVMIQKPGKEAGQGVGYLEDGTMVVVDGGQPHQDRMVEAIVTSVLQTSAGRMVFARLADDGGENA